MTAVRRWLPHAVFAVGAVTIAVGLIVRRFTDTPIGVPWPPALGNPNLGVHPLLALSLALFAAAVVLCLAAARRAPDAGPRRADPVRRHAALRLALAAGRGGPGEWDKVFDEARSFEAPNEYLPALPTVDLGPGYFLDRFAELVPVDAGARRRAPARAAAGDALPRARHARAAGRILHRGRRDLRPAHLRARARAASRSAPHASPGC